MIQCLDYAKNKLSPWRIYSAYVIKFRRGQDIEFLAKKHSQDLADGGWIKNPARNSSPRARMCSIYQDQVRLRFIVVYSYGTKHHDLAL